MTLLFRSVVWALLAGVLVVAASTLPAPAQNPPAAPPPAGLTQQQFDALVDAISQAVARKLKEGEPAPAPGHGKLAAPVESSFDEAVEENVTWFIGRSVVVAQAFPEAVRQTLAIPSALGASGHAGLGLGAFLALLALTIAAALIAEWAVRWVLAGARTHFADKAHDLPGLRALAPLAAVALLDAIGLGAVWLVTYGAIGSWFNGQDLQARVATFTLTGVFAWRLYMFAFRVTLRPALPKARLAAMSSDDAVTVYRRLSTLILAIVILRIYMQILIAMKVPADAISCVQVLGYAGVGLAMIMTARASRDALAGWFASLGSAEGRRTFGEAVGRNWLLVAIPFFILLAGAQIFGAISQRFAIRAAMLLTLNVVIGLILLETLIDFIVKPLRGAEAAAEPPGTQAALRAAEPARPRMLDVAMRCLRVAALIAGVVTIAQTWVVDVLALVDSSGWHALTRASFSAGTALFIAFVLWEIVKYVSARASVKVVQPGAGQTEGEDEAVVTATRLATLMPLLRIAMAILIGTVATLVVLSELGVNITPLIAGASVFGLAISFGSQTLVRDIVSGVFYLADDAFRVGEYIDCGKAKGTVEGFTLRSIKLRHQNGQVHTIPFGQLGQITNFSRDWSTIKFNMRFARDTDLEKLRKVVKKIGQEMLEDPEMKDEFLEPLKMQGVADILDNAVVVRFKFTVRPNKPTFIQRQAIKRMVTAFGPAGIEFATNTVAVQTLGGADAAVQGAAAISRIHPELQASGATS